jgi:hypothetical protein
MAISVNEVTKVISVPQADLTFVSGVTYTHDTDAFRLELRDWESSTPGAWRSITHKHNPPVTVGGVTLGRVIEIINGYTITYEDGQYRVILEGSNNNILDVANVNQVSIATQNSAGLIQAGTSGLTAGESAQLQLTTDLMQADEFFDKSTGLLHYYIKGTTTDIIPPKNVTGETATGDVSALE